jgi:hypothetical protein
LTINAAAKTAMLAVPKPQGPTRWPVAAWMLFFGLFLAGGRAHRKFRRSMLLSLGLLAAMLATSCGGAISKSSPTPTPTPAPTLVSYSVVVTGTASGIIQMPRSPLWIPQCLTYITLFRGRFRAFLGASPVLKTSSFSRRRPFSAAFLPVQLPLALLVELVLDREGLPVRRVVIDRVPPLAEVTLYPFELAKWKLQLAAAAHGLLRKD